MSLLAARGIHKRSIPPTVLLRHPIQLPILLQPHHNISIQICIPCLNVHDVIHLSESYSVVAMATNEHEVAEVRPQEMQQSQHRHHHTDDETKPQQQETVLVQNMLR